jgi:ectoine hydroxylase-related dioxygenase (phytanoyl-CoA dioxygenase family)
MYFRIQSKFGCNRRSLSPSSIILLDKNHTTASVDATPVSRREFSCRGMTDTKVECSTGPQPHETHLEIVPQGLDEVCSDWSFSISLTEEELDRTCQVGSESSTPDDSQTSASTTKTPVVPQHYRQAFESDGFVVIPNVLSAPDVAKLNQRLRAVLRGDNDRGRCPDKVMPKVIQIINIHKSDSLFRTLATDAGLGHVVAQLANWEHGTRLAQDQVWAKPPGAPPLVFHRDSPYFMFEPSDVVTVWVALDDMDASIGPLEYVRSSHLWGEGRVGTANQFFQSDYQTLLKSAAAKQGVEKVEVVSMAGLPRGSISVHNGRTWHGSGRNESGTRPRRGVGLHFVPSQARFTGQAAKSSLWRQYIADGDGKPEAIELPEDDFPIVWMTVDSTR